MSLRPPRSVGLVIADATAMIREYEKWGELMEMDLFTVYGHEAKVYVKGGLTFVPRYGSSFSYEGVLESVLAEFPGGEPEYVVLVSGGNDLYGPEQDVFAEEAENVNVALGIVKVAVRLWYQRIPCLLVVGASSEVFKYRGEKARVFDRRVQYTLRVARSMMAAVPLGGCKLVSGAEELAAMSAGDIVDGMGHFGGPRAYRKFLYAVSQWVGEVPAWC